MVRRVEGAGQRPGCQAPSAGAVADVTAGLEEEVVELVPAVDGFQVGVVLDEPAVGQVDPAGLRRHRGPTGIRAPERRDRFPLTSYESTVKFLMNAPVSPLPCACAWGS